MIATTLSTSNAYTLEFRKGLLLVVWGWPLVLSYLSGYALSNFNLDFWLQDVLFIIKNMSFIVGLAITLYLIIKNQIEIRTQRAITLIIIWSSFLVSMVIVNLVMFNFFGELKIVLQNSIFKILLGFATIISGRLLDSKWLILAGVLCGLLATICSFYPSENQVVINAFGWTAFFIVPGHVLQFLGHINSRKSTVND